MYIPEFETIKIEINNYQNRGFFSKLLNKEVRVGEIVDVHWLLLRKTHYRRNKIKIKCDGCSSIIEREIRHLNINNFNHFCKKCSKIGNKNPAFGKPQHPNIAKGLKDFMDEFGNPSTWESTKEKLREKRKLQVMPKGWHASEETKKRMSAGIRLAYKEGRISPSKKWGNSKILFYNEIGYQSTYELKFLKYCEGIGIFDKIERGPKIQYIGLDGKSHTYFVDYKLKNSNKIFEIKSSYIYNKHPKITELKKEAASKLYD
jgi:hypothetical protein